MHKGALQAWPGVRVLGEEEGQLTGGGLPGRTSPAPQRAACEEHRKPQRAGSSGQRQPEDHAGLWVPRACRLTCSPWVTRTGGGGRARKEDLPGALSSEQGGRLPKDRAPPSRPPASAPLNTGPPSEHPSLAQPGETAPRTDPKGWVSACPGAPKDPAPRKAPEAARRPGRAVGSGGSRPARPGGEPSKRPRGAAGTLGRDDGSAAAPFPSQRTGAPGALLAVLPLRGLRPQGLNSTLRRRPGRPPKAPWGGRGVRVPS